MRKCWAFDPDKRPTFQDIHDILSDILQQSREEDEREESEDTPLHVLSKHIPVAVRGQSKNIFGFCIQGAQVPRHIYLEMCRESHVPVEAAPDYQNTSIKNATVRYSADPTAHASPRRFVKKKPCDVTGSNGRGALLDELKGRSAVTLCNDGDAHYLAPVQSKPLKAGMQ